MDDGSHVGVKFRIRMRVPSSSLAYSNSILCMVMTLIYKSQLISCILM